MSNTIRYTYIAVRYYYNLYCNNKVRSSSLLAAKPWCIVELACAHAYYTRLKTNYSILVVQVLYTTQNTKIVKDND